MAVNMWWKHYNEDGIDEQDCSNPCDVHITLTDCKYIGIVQLEQQPDEMRYMGVLSPDSISAIPMNLFSFIPMS